MLQLLKWLFVFPCFPFFSIHSTPLDDYVRAPDPHYEWTLVKIDQIEEVKIYTVQLISQKWRTEKEVDKPLWKHELRIAVPKDLQTKTAILTIAGGICDVDTGTLYREISLEELAQKTHAIACQISLVPNQYIKMLDETDSRYCASGRREDALVAYTWDKYLKTGDETWPLRLPMTKSVVSAMNAVEEVLSQQLKLSVDGFVLMGKSKRGWTAWTTAAVDKRVKGIVPIVIDLLNLKQSFIRHYMAYGNWSPAIKDYVDIQLDKRWDDPEFTKLMNMVEPSSYNERFTMPKYIINASGDEFFLPDSSHLYFQKLPPLKQLLYLPNTGHHVALESYKESIIAYLQFLLSGQALPTYDWEVTHGSTLTVKTNEKPLYVKLWYAHNPNGRDFRVMTIGKTWESSIVNPSSDGTYQAVLNRPEKGWNAYYVEIGYTSPQGLVFRVSTDIVVLPDEFPYKAP